MLINGRHGEMYRDFPIEINSREIWILSKKVDMYHKNTILCGIMTKVFGS